MEFLLIGYDGKDAGAPERRKKHRPAHLEHGSELFEEGNLLYGGAMLDEKGDMIGSVMIARFPTRADLDAWLKTEPFVLEKVWEKLEVRNFRPGPWFQEK
jgi:uncharacterized protein YciI